MLVETFYGHCDTGLLIVKSHVLDYKVEDIRRFETISLLNSTPYEHLNGNMKGTYEWTLKETHENDESGKRDGESVEKGAVIQKE